MNDFALKIWNTMNSTCEKSQLRLLVMGSGLLILFIFAVGGFHVSTVPVDTDTYFNAGENFANGKIDIARTPVYPLVCQFATLFGSACSYVIVLIQSIVFLYSIKWLYKTARLIFEKHPLVTFVVTALYAWNLAVAQYTLVIMSESLSLSCVALMFLIVVRGIKVGMTTRNSLLLMALYVVMLFLRPFFICFAPLLLLFFVFAYKNFTRRAIIAFWAGMVIVGGAYLGYCSVYKSHYGVFTTSCVPDINLNAQLYEAGLVDTPLWKIDVYDLKVEHDHNREVLLQNRGVWFRHMVDESLLSGRQLFPKIVLSHGGKTLQPLSLQISAGMLYLLTLVFSVITFVRWRRGADVRIETLMALTIAGTVFTSVWGAFGVYTRLMLPCYTALCLVLGYFFTRFKV